MVDLVEMNIRIKSDCEFVDISRSFEDGSVAGKKVLMTDLVAIINNSLASNSHMPIGQLPYGYYNGSINPFDSSSFKVALIMPGEKRILTYYQEEHLVPYPDLLFLFAAVRGKVNISKVFSIVNKGKQRLAARYPYGNVYEDGKICWGSNGLPTVYEMKGVEQVLSLFFGSLTNDDLYAAGTCVIKKKEFLNQRGLILKAEKEQKFPEKWLISTGYTVDEMVKSFLEN